jgi:putative effector of murein hydrolase LrgA (UPF0299 family)
VSEIEERSERARWGIADHAVVLVVVSAIALIGNYVGPGNGVLEALPGMLILYCMVLVGLALTEWLPFSLPSIVWISLVGIVATLPFIPGSAWVLDRVETVDFLALATPVLAYAGLAIARREVDTFKKSGWKIVIVAFMVFLGTFLTSALIAQVVLSIQGQI